MGTEAHGTVTLGGQKVNCKADFASDHVTFSGGRRGEVKYGNIEVVGTGKGKLKIRVDGALMEFDLGDKVERIANKIRKPPSLLDKLGIKPGQEVDERVEDKRFTRLMAEHGIEASTSRRLDHFLVAVRDMDELAGIPGWAKRVKDDGALWLVYRRNREPGEREVLEAGRASGLKDVKVVRFNDTHTAIKFVKPLVDRDAALEPA